MLGTFPGFAYKHHSEADLCSPYHSFNLISFNDSVAGLLLSKLARLSW